MKHAMTMMLAVQALSFGAVIGQVDTFTAGTEGWTVALGPVGAAHPAPPVTLPGGQGGASDSFLRLTALGGGGAGSKLAAMNVFGQWSGNYLLAGINGIAMDVRNSGSTDLYLRLLFEHLGAMGPTDEAFSTQAVFLAAGSGWTRVFFPVGVAHVTADVGSAEAALSSVDVLRIFHSQAAEFPPPGAIAATLDVDNITATPEPATMLLAGGALAAIAGLRRRRVPS